MTQKTLEKFNRKFSDIRGEIKTLRSLMIGVLGKDKEGAYKPNFVKKILNLSKKRGGFVFKDTESFLKQIQKSS